MDVTLNTAISGLRASLIRQNVAAHDVANVNTPGYKEGAVQQADLKTGGVRIVSVSRLPNPSPDLSTTDLAEEAKEQILSKDALTANAKVIKVKDRMLGTLLDMVA